MKRKKKIWLAFLFYIIALIVMFFCVQYYVDFKKQKLSREICDELDRLFDGKDMYVDIAYSDFSVKYWEIDIPSKLELTNKVRFNSFIPSFAQEEKINYINDSYDEKYGDLAKLYQLKYRQSNDAFGQENGWRLFVLKRERKGVVNYNCLFPYAVGYKKTLSDYAPSVKDAVKAAYNFYTSNEQSDFSRSFEIGSYYRIHDNIQRLSNDYYHVLTEPDSPLSTHMHRPIFDVYPENLDAYLYQEGYMYNGFYKVFVAMGLPITMAIECDDDHIQRDRVMLPILGGLVFTIILLIYIIPLWRKEAKYKKIKYESLFDKLMRVCNPANFVDDYNKEKVDKANGIYQKLMATSPKDLETLQALREEAENELSISFVDKEKIAELKEKVNPKRFMKPYNAEKVSLANDLYSRLSKENISYKELMDIETKIYQMH